MALINGTPGALLVSIHQNSLPSHPSTHGAQVFFNAVDPAGEVAQGVQQALNVSLDGGKTVKAMDGVAGITGSYSFDENNNPIKSVAIIELTGGEEVFKEMF